MTDAGRGSDDAVCLVGLADGLRHALEGFEKGQSSETSKSSHEEPNNIDSTRALSVAWHVSMGADTANTVSATQLIMDNKAFNIRNATTTEVTSEEVHAGGVAVTRASRMAKNNNTSINWARGRARPPTHEAINLQMNFTFGHDSQMILRCDRPTWRRRRGFDQQGFGRVRQPGQPMLDATRCVASSVFDDSIRRLLTTKL